MNTSNTMSVQQIINRGLRVTADQPDVIDIATQLNSTPKSVAAMINQLIYRANYNKKPEVKAARVAYNKQRNLEFKRLRQLVKDNPELLS